MTIVRFAGFSGEIPKLIPRLLPDAAAQKAVNLRLDDGGLTPTRRAREVHGFPAGSAVSYQTIYHHAGSWLGWDGVVHAAPGPVATDRLYYTGDGAPKMRVAGTVYPLALNRPSAALNTSKSGTGSGDVRTRLYTYTWVTDFGEESENAAPSAEITWQSGQSVTLSNFASPPSGRGIVKQRIYRSQTGTSGGTQFYLIAERTAASTDYVDSGAADDFDAPLPSKLYHPPPDTLAGLTALPNGIMAAFDGKYLYFSEPWRPHAWPEPYILTTDYPIVGLAAFGTSLAVITEGVPYLVSGTSPDSMVMEELELNLPCINARSIVDLGYAAAYAAHDGLVVISEAGAQVVTRNTLSRDDWLAMNPAGFVSAQFEGRYLASYSYTDAEGVSQTGSIILDLSGAQPFIVRSSMVAKAMAYDLEQSKLFYLAGESVYEWDARGEIRDQFTWRSKDVVLPKPSNFGAILIESDDVLSDSELDAIEAEATAIRAANQTLWDSGVLGGALNEAPLNAYALNADGLQAVPEVNQSIGVAVYADGELRAVVNAVNATQRLPGGFLARQWEIEVTGDIGVTQIALAGTASELMGV